MENVMRGIEQDLEIRINEEEQRINDDDDSDMVQCTYSMENV